MLPWNVIGQANGYADAVTVGIHSAWRAFHKPLPILMNRGVYLLNRENAFVTCLISDFLYGAETWSISTEALSASRGVTLR